MHAGDKGGQESLLHGGMQYVMDVFAEGSMSLISDTRSISSVLINLFIFVWIPSHQSVKGRERV